MRRKGKHLLRYLPLNARDSLTAESFVILRAIHWACRSFAIAALLKLSSATTTDPLLVALITHVLLVSGNELPGCGTHYRRSIGCVQIAAARKANIIHTQFLGIGKATALEYAKEGCKRIAIADINVELLHQVAVEIKKGGADVEVKVIVVDVRSQDSVTKMVVEAVSTFGRIDYCANVAGIIRFGDTSVLPPEDFDLVYQINLRGVFLCAKAEINAMLKQEPLLSR